MGRAYWTRLRWAAFLTTACALAWPIAARAEVAGTAGLGGTAVQIGAFPRFAVTPSAEVGLVFAGWSFSLRDQLSFMPPAFGPQDLSVSVHNRTAIAVGYASPRLMVAIGGSVAQYAMTACSADLCGRVVGVAPGVDLSIDYYPFNGRTWAGARVSGSLAYYDGGSEVLRQAWAGMVTAGPVFRFGGAK